MEIILKTVNETNEELPYLALQRKVGLPNDTYRKSINTLRNLDILKKPSSGSKKIPIRFTPEARRRYPYIDLPNTYLSLDELRKRENRLGSKVVRESRKVKEEIYSIRYATITQYFLLRAVYGTTYTRPVTNKLEQGLPGLIRTYEDMRGYSYSSEDIKATLTEKERKALVPITLETDTIPGVSVMDLVNHRDVGSGGYFRYIKTTREECETIVPDLVRRRILIQMAYGEIHDALTNIKHKEAFDPLLREPRYKIATEALNRYIGDWNSLQYFIEKRIEATRKRPNRLQQEIELYTYYLGHKIMNDLRTRIKLEHQEMLMDEKNNRMEKPREKSVVPRRRKMDIWDNLIRQKLIEIRNKKEYIEIRTEFPILHEVFMKPLKDVLGVLKMGQLVW